MAPPSIRDLERDVARLRRDLERYQDGSELTLEALDGVIGWFDRNRQPALARDLRRNTASIRRALLDTRPE